MRGYDLYIVKVDRSRRLPRRNKKYLRKFEAYKPEGLKVPQPQTLQDRVAAREEPLTRPDPIPAGVGETPRPTPQSTLLPRSTTPAATLVDVPHREISRENTTLQDVQTNQPTETLQLQDEDVELPH